MEVEKYQGYRRYAENEKEALAMAADLLIAEGWTSGTARDGEGRRCVSQALCSVVGLSELATVRNKQVWLGCLDRLKADRALDGYRSIFEWNDEPGRTADEVLGLLRRAADAL